MERTIFLEDARCPICHKEFKQGDQCSVVEDATFADNRFDCQPARLILDQQKGMRLGWVVFQEGEAAVYHEVCLSAALTSVGDAKT
jgi:hypothetical protein